MDNARCFVHFKIQTSEHYVSNLHALIVEMSCTAVFNFTNKAILVKLLSSKGYRMVCTSSLAGGRGW